jgi:hypothetical protein
MGKLDLILARLGLGSSLALRARVGWSPSIAFSLLIRVTDERHVNQRVIMSSLLKTVTKCHPADATYYYVELYIFRARMVKSPYAKDARVNDFKKILKHCF